MAKRDEIVRYLDTRLALGAFEDTSANGLQVEGAPEVTRIALAADAALAVYRRAADAGCEMIFVHHGLIWGGLRAVTGRVREHIAFLLDHGINLYAAHLPLDAHPEIGNNIELARLMDMRDPHPFGRYHGVPLGFRGTLPEPVSPDDLAVRCRARLGGDPVWLAFGKPEIRTVGVVSGGGSSCLGEAIADGLDCFVTGEGQHQDFHLAAEAGMNVLYLGHYRSEIVGVQAVGRELHSVFGLETAFIDVPTIF